MVLSKVINLCKLNHHMVWLDQEDPLFLLHSPRLEVRSSGRLGDRTSRIGENNKRKSPIPEFLMHPLFFRRKMMMKTIPSRLFFTKRRRKAHTEKRWEPEFH